MEIPQAKVCTKCGLSKSLDEFAKKNGGKYGRQPHCRACKNATDRNYSVMNPDKVRAYNAARKDKPKVVPEEKTCRTCKRTKPIDEFGFDQSTKDGHATRCKFCKRSESKGYRTENPIKVRIASARWKAEHPAELAAYALANAPKRNAQRKTRYATDPAKENAQTSAYYFAKKDELRPKRRAWDQAHPEFAHEKNKRRRAQIAGSEINDLTHAQWVEIQEAQKHRCYYCGKRCKGKLTQDHLTPLSKGGLHTLHNVIAVCVSCNSRKGPRAIPVSVQPMLLTVAPSRKLKKKGS